MSWAFRKRLTNFFRSSLWVVPAFSTLAAFLSVPLLRVLDRSVGFHFFRYTPDGARALASIVSSAMLSFVVLFFSVLLLTVQIASSSLSPRIISRPFRSRTLKASLGLFVFNLIYSMAVVARGTEGNIGQLATAMVIVLTVVSVCVFLFVVEHVSKQLRPATVIADIAAEGLQVIGAVYPQMLQAEATVQDTGDADLAGQPSRIVKHYGNPGVVQSFDIQGLSAIAVSHACIIELVPQVGDFVTSHDEVFRIHGPSSGVSAEELFQHIALQPERTLEQDPSFAFRIIVDIACKALSPAINDPTTAVLALDQIHILLREVGRRRLDTGAVHASGKLRLLYRTPNWEDFVVLAVTEIRQFGANSTQVARRMRALLEDLIPILPAHRAMTLQQELDLLTSTINHAFAVPQDRTRAELPDSLGIGGAQKHSPSKANHTPGAAIEVVES
jgi:uncharacterized membrane protein